MTDARDQAPRVLAPIDRAIRDAAKDRSLADELLDAANLQELHTLCRRMIDERETVAKGFNAVVQAWSLIDDKGSSPDSVAAVERIATEAIQFAREVVQALKPTK
jgi:hypothetical protein